MTDVEQQLPVLIVGGGIGGLAAALALARKGCRVRLIEQAADFKEIGAGIQLGPNVFRMFEELGLTAAINRLAAFPENLIMLDSTSGAEVTRIPLTEDFRARFKHPYALIYRADLLAVLLDACRGSDLIQLVKSQKVVHVEEAGDRVMARTQTGESHEGSALIGADGLWSTIRQILVGDGKPVVAGHITYRAVLPAADMPPDLRWWSMVLWAGEKVHLVHYPMRGGALFNLVAVFHSSRYEEGWDSYGDPAELHERFAKTCAPVRTLIDKIESWRMWVLCDRPPIRDWSRGRLTLLGDAAHPMLQYLAQGACMAIEDAVCLANKVEALHDDFAAAFQAYQEARYLRTGRVQIMARVYGEFYHASGVARELRNIMLGGRTPEQAFESMQWLYGEDDGPTGYGSVLKGR
jgi:2-polyprenyl-6-methoxyphenol hydroxylase-like FAD-dependent oxidoreductase